MHYYVITKLIMWDWHWKRIISCATFSARERSCPIEIPIQLMPICIDLESPLSALLPPQKKKKKKHFC